MKEVDAGTTSTRPNGIDVRTIAEVGIAVALAAVLSLIPAFELPQGGSVSLEMIPLLFLAVRRGPKIGVWAGVIYGLINLIMKPYIVHPAQVVLDYPLAFGLVGLAGLIKPDSLVKVGVGTILGGLARFAASYVSGVIFWASNAPKGQSAWLYSLIYNSSYMLPSTLVAIPIVYALLQAFKKAGIGEPLTRS